MAALASNTWAQSVHWLDIHRIRRGHTNRIHPRIQARRATLRLHIHCDMNPISTPDDPSALISSLAIRSSSPPPSGLTTRPAPSQSHARSWVIVTAMIARPVIVNASRHHGSGVIHENAATARHTRKHRAASLNSPPPFCSATPESDPPRPQTGRATLLVVAGDLPTVALATSSRGRAPIGSSPRPTD